MRLSGNAVAILADFEAKVVQARHEANVRLAIARDFALACGVRPMDIRFARRLNEERIEVRDGEGTPWRVAHRQWWHVERDDGYTSTLCMEWMP